MKSESYLLVSRNCDQSHEQVWHVRQQGVRAFRSWAVSQCQCSGFSCCLGSAATNARHTVLQTNQQTAFIVETSSSDQAVSWCHVTQRFTTVFKKSCHWTIMSQFNTLYIFTVQFLRYSFFPLTTKSYKWLFFPLRLCMIYCLSLPISSFFMQSSYTMLQ